MSALADNISDTTNVTDTVDITDYEVSKQEISGNLSVSGRLWQIQQADLRQVAAMMQHHDFPEHLARLLCVRGVELDQAEDFIAPSLKNMLPDPYHLLDMEKAVRRIETALSNGEMIAIWGDYDVDGATSSALLLRYFRAVGAKAQFYIPDRIKEGYGPNAAGLLALKDSGVNLVITVDCGTLAFAALDAAAEAGIDVIVVDHHLGEARRPQACAVINPNRLDESSPHRHLAAVGVAFLLLIALNKHLRESRFFSTLRPQPDLRRWLDIVALGTICDVVPLLGVNRALVAQGLKVMAARENLGIRAIMDIAGLDERPGVYHAGFVIGPRINAGGRVGKADLGTRLLISENEEEALQIARQLDHFNSERKAIEAMIQEQADEIASRLDSSLPLMVVAGKSWHQGVIGIVAGRLKERFRKPVAVIAVNDNIGKASARSVSGMDLGAAVIAAMNAGLLIAGGGHAMAAGFTVAEEKIPQLSEFLCEYLRPHSHHLARGRALNIDIALSIAGINEHLAVDIEKLGPFGCGNYPVRIAISGVINLRPEIVGENHVKTLLLEKSGKARLSAISFRCLDQPLGQALLATRGREIDVAGQLRLQEWQGKPQLSLMIEDIMTC